jgi:hypothetical protein
METKNGKTHAKTADGRADFCYNYEMFCLHKNANRRIRARKPAFGNQRKGENHS